MNSHISRRSPDFHPPPTDYVKLTKIHGPWNGPSWNVQSRQLNVLLGHTIHVNSKGKISILQIPTLSLLLNGFWWPGHLPSRSWSCVQRDTRWVISGSSVSGVSPFEKTPDLLYWGFKYSLLRTTLSPVTPVLSSGTFSYFSNQTFVQTGVTLTCLTIWQSRENTQFNHSQNGSVDQWLSREVLVHGTMERTE